MTPRERVLFYWLLRAYQAHHREGWEPGPSAEETFDDLVSFLFNQGMDPNLHDEAKKLVEEQTLFTMPTPDDRLARLLSQARGALHSAYSPTNGWASIPELIAEIDGVLREVERR